VPQSGALQLIPEYLSGPGIDLLRREPMRNITIKVIPDSKQRYETSGDYWIDKRGTIQVRISKSKNWRYEALGADA
jgi:hypothetical protein